MNKVLDTLEEAISAIPDGATVAIGGFFAAGVPMLLRTLIAKKVMNLTLVCGSGPLLGATAELNGLVENRQIRKVIDSYGLFRSATKGANHPFEQQIRSREEDVHKLEGLPREIIALRVSREIEDHSYVNLGIGIPTIVSNWLEGRDVILQAEIGMLKTGSIAEGDDIDQDFINANCQPVLEMPGTVYFDMVESFAMIRGGHVDVTVMRAFQVNVLGDFASWFNPSRGLNGVGNIGGSMDLAVGAKKLFIAMEHQTNKGEPKVVNTLTYPATAKKKVQKIFTDLAVIDVTPDGQVLREIYPGLTVEELQSVTEPTLIIPPDLREIEL
jgi:3-oxoacid CoA-transferase subunit B